MGEHQVAAGKRRAVFLDRDGVLNRAVVRDGRPYPPQSVDHLQLTEGAAEACDRLKRAGFLLVVITNQPDVGRGKQDRSVVDAINQRLCELIPALDHFEVCFHAGADYGEPCDCRKPQPGMIHRAAAALNLDLRSSFVIGDRWQDVNCARAVGCTAIFIDYGYTESLQDEPDLIVATFAEAVSATLRALPYPTHSL